MDVEQRLRESLEGHLQESVGPLAGGLAELRSRLEEVATAGVDEQVVEGLRGRVEGLERHLETAPGAAELRDALARELAGVEQRLRDVLDERAVEAVDAVAAIRRELDDTRARLAGEAAALEERLRSAFDESAATAAQAGERARQEDLNELREQLESHAERLAAAESADGLAALGAELRSAVDELRGQLSDDREHAAEAASRAERAIGDLSTRQDQHEQRAAAEREGMLADAEARVLGAVREELSALAHRLDDAESRAVEAHGALGLALEGVDARVEDAALRSAEHAAAIEHTVRRELESLAATAEERDAAAIDARAEAREQLERLTSSLAWRIERVEEALAGDDRDELRELVGLLERRLEAQAAQSDELVRQTEKALRKGLASLGARLSESEEAYVEAGHALRRSIERLGLAVRDADERLAPDAPAADPIEGSYLAFAPVGDGYRLVELQGPAPEVGDEVALPDGVGGLVATRVSRSPLPFDTRSCVYLERGPPEAAD
jgi:hypothetical protein